MTLFDTWAGTPALRAFLDQLTDAVLLLDRRGRVSFANGVALRTLRTEAGTSLEQLGATLGTPAVQWVQQCLERASQRRAAPPAPPAAAWLPDGRPVQLAWQPLDARHSALRLAIGAPPAAAPALPQALGAIGEADLVRVLWESPFPALLQDASFRIVDVNQAFAEFAGHARERLVGVDPLALVPEDDRAELLAQRRRGAGSPADIHPVVDQRLIDAGGRERWFRAARTVVIGDGTAPHRLVLLQDSTAEHVARERADRSARELDHWFDLSPIGMVLFDEAGLLVRTNPAFEALIGTVPETLPEAPEALQQLLAWEGRMPAAELRSGPNAVVAQCWLETPDGGRRRLRSTVRRYTTPGGQRRYMAVVEDRSVEEERDLAQMQIGALMHTAGVGLATFQESSGWVRQRQGAPTGGETTPASAALQSISREIVLPESLPEYERLQNALRHSERVEVRYAIRHPELGRRWLLTRVEPATLASGNRTTSVVTLDITEQHQTQQRSEQLARELTTILESTTAGIAYLRGNVLVRCNQQFEAMLGVLDGQRGGVAGGGLAGSNIHEMFGESALAQRIAADTLQALADGMIYETEFEVTLPPGSGPVDDAPQSLWYALSVRRTAPVSPSIEAIAMLSDVTRLKTQQIELERLARDRELMFSLSEVGIAFLRHGRIDRANDALAALTGYPADELAGLKLEALFPEPAEYRSTEAHQEAALRHYGRWIGERQVRRRDGRLLWVQVSKRLVSDSDPAAGIIASYVNVDDRHRAEQAVALQAERTRAILDSVLVGIVTVGKRGIEWMNRSARRMFGGDLADFVGQPISTVATADPDHPFLRVEYLDELTEGQAETFECCVKARDGREFWVVGNVVAIGAGSGGRQLTYALLDIERRRQAEARTAEAQASLQRIIEAAPMAITLRDARTLRVLHANEVAAQSVGLAPAAMAGRAPEEIFPAEVAAGRRADMEAALASPGMTHREYADGSGGADRVWDARYMPLAAPGQPPDQLLLVASDVTEQRAAQQARFEAELAQREMLVKEVHHRIKNNLQGVAGLLQQIAARKPEVAPAIAEVVGQVQAIAQVYGLQVGVSGPLRLTDVVEAITVSVQRTFGRTITLAIDGPAPSQWVLPESESIPIALTVNELLTNAIKHSAREGTSPVACRLSSLEGGVRLAIANRGRLPEGFALARFPGGVSGLGLVRSLLPRRNAALGLEQQGDEVVASVALQPPVVRRLEPPPA